MTKQIIFGNGQPVFNVPALEPDPIAARFEAEKHAENAKRLRVCVESEDDERNISREEAPALFEAWDHWCDRNNVDMQEVLRRAKRDYDAETANEGVQFTASN